MNDALTRPATSAARHQHDLYDLPLTTTVDAAELFRDAQARLLKVQVGVVEPLQAALTADPDFAVGHATLAMLARDLDLSIDTSEHLRIAMGNAFRATERERSFIDVVISRLAGTRDHQDRLLHHIAEHPRDALALHLAAPTIAFAGSIKVAEQAWAVVEQAKPAFGSDWFYSGMLAFVRQEQGHFAEAGELAMEALVAEPAAGHAAHALAHVFYGTRQHSEGLRWIDGWIRDHGPDSFQPSHYSWHAALHELAQGNEAAVRARYARELSPSSVQGERALVDSASLLWRARLDDSWVGDVPIDEVLSVVDHDLLMNPPTPFVALHAAIALAARGDAVGLRVLGRNAGRNDRADYRELVVPLTAAMSALVDRRPDRAAQILLRLMPAVDRFGGSKAQREVIELTLLHALIESGHARAAQQLIQHALDRPVLASPWIPAQRSGHAVNQ